MVKSVCLRAWEQLFLKHGSLIIVRPVCVYLIVRSMSRIVSLIHQKVLILFYREPENQRRQGFPKEAK